MGGDRFLRVIGGRYDFRRRVPPELVEAIGKRELIQSLGSLPYRQARAKARELAVRSDELFATVKGMNKLDARRAVELARDHFRERLDQYERERRDPKKLQAGSRIALRDDAWHVATSAADYLLGREGLTADPQSEPYMALCRGLIRASAEIGRIAAARREGDYTAGPLDPLFAGDHGAPATVASPKFSEAWTRFVAEKTKTRAWRDDMRRENANTYALFVEWCGDRRLDRYRRTQISDFAGMLQALPALRGKVPAFTGKRLIELLDMTKADPSIKTLSPKSIKKHTSNISSFFGWCIDQGYVDANPAKGVFKFKRTVRRNEEREAWTADQLITLFRSPLYQGSVSAYYRARPGKIIVKDARYWLPLLLSYHPLRLEEAAQLRVVDVKREGEIWYLDVHAAEDGAEDTGAPSRKLKTRAAWRRVPLHSLLIEVGFVDHVDGLRQRGETMVFPELRPGGTAKRLGYSISKWFPTYRTAVGIEGVDLHAMRHAAITALVAAGVHPDMVDFLDGHETPGERGRYGKAPELRLLRDAIEAIRYPGIDTGIIRP